jgi:glyoxylase-like metal-dependent hydrolase (beta-lactamase superfamily II)
MRVHHLNCATMCPAFVGRMVCHCLLVELGDGLLLVDTGLGTHDLARPHARLGRPFVSITRPRFDAGEPALAQLQRLGFSARDVRHIVVTHLDLDHAGGLSDFPEAEVHVAQGELAAAMNPRMSERGRYRRPQWAHGPHWREHAWRPNDGEPWHGFGGVRAINGLPPEILLVPLLGHTRGHHGIAIRRDDGWMLHAGDAYFHYGEVQADAHCPAPLRAFQRLVAVDDDMRKANRARLRALALDRDAGVRVFCAHDPTELSRLQPSQ